QRATPREEDVQREDEEGYGRNPITPDRNLKHAPLPCHAFVRTAPYPRPSEPAVSRGRSVRAFTGQDDPHRLEEDKGIQDQRVVLHVIQIVLELLRGIVDRSPVLVTNLRPPGDAGLDAVPHRIERNLL